MIRELTIVKEPCSECSGRLEKKYVSQEFERGEVRIRLSGIVALACTDCGEIYFQPGGADKVAKAANSLFELAITERQHKHQLTAQICQA